MVQKIISTVLISSIISGSLAFADQHQQGLHLQWEGSHSSSCQRLIEAFLTELRQIATDRTIEIDMSSNPRSTLESANLANLKKIQIECQENRTNAPSSLQVKDALDPAKQNAISLRYLSKAEGFDATDWLLFQERFLRSDDLARLAPPSSSETVSSAVSKLPQDPIAQSESSSSSSESHSIFQKWWFWGLVGGAGLGTYLMVHALDNRPSSTMNIEIK